MMKTYIFLPLIAILGAGCANPYQKNFTTLVAKAPKSEPLRLEEAQGPPKMLTTTSMRDDAIRLLEEGYLPIGRSELKSNDMYAASALALGEQLGAALIVIKAQSLGSVTQTIPIQDWIPDRRITTYETNRVLEPGRKQTTTHVRESTTVIEGEYQTHYIPQTTDYFEFVATFWKKARPPKFGVLVSDLSAEMRKKIESNRGVLVKVVTRDSPAFLADLFRGDIIRSFGGEEVSSANHFFSLVQKNAGKEVSVVFLRDDRKITKNIKLEK